MGLTLNYCLRAGAKVTDAEIPALVAAMHAAAAARQRSGLVDAVSTVGSEPEDLCWHSEWLQVPVPGEANTSRGIEVPVVVGYVFTVSLSEGSEPLRLGLCRYPLQVTDSVTGQTRAVRRRGWRFASGCKTQYASLHGWENFRRAHTAGVELLAELRGLGLKVQIQDEGGYWPDRKEAELRRRLDRMNGLVAGLSGALKDAADESGGPSLQAPILAHPQFERLEADGVAQEGAAIDDAVKRLRQTKGHRGRAS